MPTEPFGLEHLDRPPDQLDPRITKKPLGLSMTILPARSIITTAFSAASTTSRKQWDAACMTFEPISAPPTRSLVRVIADP
jgi:hypothetical protein